jgi:acyl-coenzyme A synthetase/AMP-(fatty) acid ligase
VVLVTDRSFEPRSVRTFLSAQVPEFMLPRYVEFAETIPKTETQKILRRALRYISPHVFDLTLDSPNPLRKSDG